MSHKSTPSTISTIGIDIGKNSFHLVGLDQRGAILLQQKVSRAQLERYLANIPRCLIGMEACSGLCVLKTRFGNSGDEGRRAWVQIRCGPRAGWRDGSER